MRLWTALVLVALGLIGVSGCESPHRVTGSVVLYTSVPPSIIHQIEEAFEKAYPTVDLRVRRGGTSDVEHWIEEDLAATGHVRADVMWVADFTVGEAMKQRGLLLQYTPSEAEALLPTLRDPDGYYFAARLLNMVIAYNTHAVTSPPTSYWDLLDPRYRGRIGHATPVISGAFHYFVGTLLHDPAYGETFFRRLAANRPSFQNNRETTARIAAGELDIGITIDFTVRNLLRKNPQAPIAFVYPEDGVVMVPSPIAIFKDATNLPGAKAFECYVLSRTGQALLRDVAGVVPVRLDVATPPDIESITQLRVIPSDPAWIQAHHDEIRARFREIFGVP